ncbi:MAG: hypothetical protein LBU36_06070 [Clostridiales bacterium]|jgi:hypothetical protein|nr:hypothetical protein [Clostridiales bacterium]
MLTGAERKIGGKKVAFLAGISAEKTPSKKVAFLAGISAEKTPILSRFSRTSAVKEGALSFSWKLKTPSHDFENCYKRPIKNGLIVTIPFPSCQTHIFII